MANIPAQLYRGDSDYLDTISNVDGQILFDTDKKEIFMDDGTTRESYGGGAGDKVYATKAEAIADLANISDTDTVFVKEGTSTDMQTITYATWQTYSDAQKEAFNGYITNFPNEAMNASAVTYDNTDSGLTADNVQEAIDEINTDLSNNMDLEYIELGSFNSTGSKTLNNGMSNYSTLMFILSLGTSHVAPCILPRSLFAISGAQALIDYRTGSTAIIDYVDNTTINITTLTAAHTLRVYGVKVVKQN